MIITNQITNGSVLVLRDENTIQKALEDKIPNALEGLNWTIKDVKNYKEEDNICYWTIISFSDSEKIVFLKTVEDEQDIKVLEAPEWFISGTRSDMLDNEWMFFFKEPADVMNFIPSDLEFSDFFEDSDYGMMHEKHNGMHGTFSGRPFTIHEYSSESGNQSIILEEGGLDADNEILEEGGLISYFVGYDIHESDIEILKK